MSAEEVCGETIDHDLRELAEGLWECKRCGAEIVAETVEEEALPEPVAAAPDPTLAALSARARDLSLSITNPATLARKLRESLIALVGPTQSRAYHIGASYDSEKEEVQVQIATVTPNFLARLQVEQGGVGGQFGKSGGGTSAQLEIAYQRTVNGWEVTVGAAATFSSPPRMEDIKQRDGKDVQVGASFSVTVRR